MARLLLVDDSEAILSFERAALGADHALAFARSGQEALEELARARPDAVLLDLTMPGMSGEELLGLAKADPSLSSIPVVVVTSEASREAEVRRIGAEGFLLKPLRADVLSHEVGRVLALAERRARARGVAVLALAVGGVRFAVPLESVARVIQQVQTRLVPGLPSYLREVVLLPDGAVPVLDVAARLGVQHQVELLDRKLVVVGSGGARLALCVDEVSDPEEIADADVTPAERLGGGEGPLRAIVRAFVRSGDVSLALLEPAALVPHALARSLPELARLAGGGPP